VVTGKSENFAELLDSVCTKTPILVGRHHDAAANQEANREGAAESAQQY
jgi:hypothetical protein